MAAKVGGSYAGRRLLTISGARDQIEPPGGAGSRLQRALKEAIAPKSQLGPVRAPPICSMKLPRWRDSASLARR